jgi:hypothetical protein
MKTISLKLNKFQNLKKVRGIAMVESIMAISIVIIAIMGPIAISLSAAKEAKYGLYKVTASNLANEQIEMIMNYKKSLDIFCFNNPNFSNILSISCGEDGFNIFVNDVLTSGCTLNSSNPCFFDESSFSYALNSVPSLSTPKTSCKIMVQSNDIAKCDNGGSVTSGDASVFTRKLYIDNVDVMKDTGGSSINTTLRLTSLVCINNASCIPGDKRAITIVSYIYR